MICICINNRSQNIVFTKVWALIICSHTGNIFGDFYICKINNDDTLKIKGIYQRVMYTEINLF